MPHPGRAYAAFARENSGVATRIWSLVLGLFLGFSTLAQEAPPIFHGNWTATAGPTRVLRGTWSGQALPRSPNAAHGSWTLFTESNEILLEGTWSAQKTRQGWQGTWTARTRQDRSFSGTWKAAIAHLAGNTLEQMLAAEKEVAGSWRSGRYEGNWWLNSRRFLPIGPRPSGGS